MYKDFYNFRRRHLYWCHLFVERVCKHFHALESIKTMLLTDFLTQSLHLSPIYIDCVFQCTFLDVKIGEVYFADTMVRPVVKNYNERGEMEIKKLAVSSSMKDSA